MLLITKLKVGGYDEEECSFNVVIPSVAIHSSLCPFVRSISCVMLSTHPGPGKVKSPVISVVHDIHIIRKEKVLEYDVLKSPYRMDVSHVIENFTK